MNIYQQFWASAKKKTNLTQLERYQAKGAPDYILRFISIGGGPGMGTTMESFARYKFKNLEKRSKGNGETGYDHILRIDGRTIHIEQKSSGYWGENDFTWQHVENDHKWNILLLCGITYTDVKFWGMNREVFNRLCSESKITNQGNKTGESSEGVWFKYSAVKDSLVELNNEKELRAFVV